MIKIDEHSPEKFRVNGTLPNIDGFMRPSKCNRVISCTVESISALPSGDGVPMQFNLSGRQESAN